MSHLHRFYAKNAPSIWELEGRWMRAAGTFRAPSAVQWIATSACDLTCHHCYSRAGSPHPASLTTAEALDMVDQIAEAGADQLVIAGGEPLLRKDLELVVERVAERGMSWSMHTHGGWVARREGLFREHPPSMVAVSLDGPREEHDAFRGRKGAYDAALNAMALLVAWGVPEVIAGTTVTRRNADLLTAMMPIVQGSAAHGWGLHLFAPEGRGEEKSELLPTPGQLARAAGFCQRTRHLMNVVLDNEWGSAGRLDPLYRDEPFLCGAGRFTAVIAVDGAVMPCTTTDAEASEGNIREERFGQIWKRGFGTFRGEGGDPAAADGLDCWLQARHGHSCRSHAFGVTPRAMPEMPKQPSGPRRLNKPLRWAATMALSALAAQTASAAEACEVPAPDFDLKAWAKTQLQNSAWTQSYRSTSKDFPKYRAVRDGKNATVAELTAALDELEAGSVWDGEAVQVLWQKTPMEGDLTQWLARLARHARVKTALQFTESALGEVVHIPWMSKAGPPPGYVHKPAGVDIPKGFEKEFKQHLEAGDPSSWTTEVTLDVKVDGPAVLCRDGKTQQVAKDARLRLRRFDTIGLHEGTTMSYEKIPLAKGGSWSTRTLPSPPALKERLDKVIADPTSEDDYTRLVGVLPLMHGPIREAVAKNDETTSYRLIHALQLWDR